MNVATPYQPPATGLETVGDAVCWAAGVLAKSGIDTSRLDAQVLLAYALNVTREAVFGYPERVLTGPQRDAFIGLIDRRSLRQPLAQIVGRREFWGRDFRVTPDTLAPRPDSETLISAVLDRLPPVPGTAPVRILDLGTGTGCLVLTLVAELANARGVGVDASDAALEVARLNRRDLGLEGQVQFVRGDWCAAIPRGGAPSGERFDVVVANPPYITDRVMRELAPEVVGYEPALALCGGPDGLDAYRAIGPQLAQVLAPQGLAVLEVGAGQAQDVVRFLTDGGMKILGIDKDLAGIERCIVASSVEKVGSGVKKMLDC